MFSCPLWVLERLSSWLCGFRPQSGASDSFPERSRPKSELALCRRGIRSCAGQAEGLPRGPVHPACQQTEGQVQNLCCSIRQHLQSSGLTPPSRLWVSTSPASHTRGDMVKARLTHSGAGLWAGSVPASKASSSLPRTGQAAPLSCQSASEGTWPGPSPGPRKAMRHRPG